MRSVDVADARGESSDSLRVGPVLIAVGADEVWLFDESDLDLEGSDEPREANEADDVGDHHCESRGRDEHGGEDRVSC